MKLYELTYLAEAALANATVDDETGELVFSEEHSYPLTEFKDKAVAVAAYLRGLETEAEAIQSAAKAMQERAVAARKRAEGLREYLKRNMEAAEITRIECPWFVLSVVGSSASVQIRELDLIPTEFLRTKTITEPDKTAIKRAIESGQEIKGASLVAGSRLIIK